MFGAAWAKRLRESWSDIRFDRREAGGAVADLGTFLPLLVGMVSRCGLALGPALVCAGIAGVVAGLTFGIPIPIQPMKAIAVVAITEGMTVCEILAAGILTGAVMLGLGATGLIVRLDRVIPRVLIRAIQLALGLKLLFTGYDMAVASRPWVGNDNIVLTTASLALLILLHASRRIPPALVVFLLGLAALLVWQPRLFSALSLGFDLPRLQSISTSDWVAGLWRGAVPQIPLTVLNSIMAVSLLSADLFGPRRAEPRRLALSLGLLNVLLCPFGAMPMCHGASGLAAHYRFGGRTGGCPMILGLANIALGLLFGASLLPLISVYPRSILGVLLAFAGVELALVCRSVQAPKDILVMVVCAMACLVTNYAIGFLLGATLVTLLRVGERVVAARRLRRDEQAFPLEEQQAGK